MLHCSGVRISLNGRKAGGPFVLVGGRCLRKWHEVGAVTSEPHCVGVSWSKRGVAGVDGEARFEAFAELELWSGILEVAGAQTARLVDKQYSRRPSGFGRGQGSFFSTNPLLTSCHTSPLRWLQRDCNTFPSLRARVVENSRPLPRKWLPVDTFRGTLPLTRDQSSITMRPVLLSREKNLRTWWHWPKQRRLRLAWTRGRSSPRPHCTKCSTGCPLPTQERGDGGD